jgi:hypothetical protein
LLTTLLMNFSKDFQLYLNTHILAHPQLKFNLYEASLITKHNRIFYRIKGNQIEVINMYDTRSNPKKNKYM